MSIPSHTAIRLPSLRLAGPALALLAGVITATAAETPLRVVLLTGLNHHKWAETTPEITGALRESGRFTIKEVRPPSPADTAASEAFRLDLAATDVIVNNWTDYPVKLAADQKAAFPWMDQVFEFVRKGGGYVGVHAASFERHPEFLRLAGMHWRRPDAGVRITVDDDGKIVRTPAGEGPGSGHGPIFEWSVKTRASAHPVMAGLPGEWPHLRDELWHGVRGPAEEIELLATAWSPETKAHEPMLWTVSFGEGRSFMTLLGHDGAAMKCPGFRHTLARGTEWAATGKVTLPLANDFPGRKAQD